MSITSPVSQERSKADASYRHGPGFLLATLGGIAERRWASYLKKAQLKRSDYAILAVLHEAGGMRQRDVAGRAGMDPRNAVPIVEDLRRRGLVATIAEPSDSRAKRVELTTRGLGVVTLLHENLHRDRDDFFESLPKDDYETLCRLLRTVYDAHVS